jgi:hypothetical protein
MVTISALLALAACGGGGGGSAGGTPTASVSATASAVASGAATTLTWSSTNATSCMASGGWSGTLATSGSQSTGALTQSTTYSLSCTGPSGTSSIASVTVNIIPTATLAADPTSVLSGGTSMLTWSSTDATSCQAGGAWSGTLATTGTQPTAALTTDSVFTITCTGPGGNSAAATASVSVVPLPTVNLTATPMSIAQGAAAMLTWSSTNATACTASGGWSGSLPASGTQSTGALASSTTYSLTCTGPGGSSGITSTLVTVSPPASAALTAAPLTVALGGSSQLTWTSTNATSCMASGGWSGSLPASGSQSTGALNANTAFSLICSGPGGSSALATVSIAIAAPTVSLSAAPLSIVSGGSSQLTWTSTNATACTASGTWSGTLAVNGTQSTGALTTSGSYSLQCAGPGGTSATASVTVYPASSALAPKLASIALTQTVQLNATLPGGAAANWSVDGIAGGSATVGTISASGLYTAGTLAGRHAILATSVSDISQAASGIVAVTDSAGMLTYHNDLSRDGANVQEYALQPGNVSAATFGKLASCAVDGSIYSQPLWIPNVLIAGARHNVVLVTTQHDSLYAFDADAAPCVNLWTASLIDSTHGANAGETPVPSTKIGVAAGDIAPEIGITSTPVIDPASGTVFVVSKSIDAGQTIFYTRLHAIDLTTGLEKSAPVLMGGSYPNSGGTAVNFDSHQQLQRAGLALVNGTVYAAFGSHEDSNPWYGWVMSYQYSGSAFTQTAIFNTAPDTAGGGIWMGGGAPSVDTTTGNLFVVTGNGTFDVTNPTPPNHDYGDSLIALTPALSVAQYYTPSDELVLSQQDKDFGSGGSTVLADLPAGNAVLHVLVCGGKDGFLLVLNRDALGSFNGPIVQSISLGNHGMFSTPTFWNNTLYVAGRAGPLQSFTLNASTAQFTAATSSSHTYGFPGATAAISAAGAQNGIVWTIDAHNYCTRQSPACGPAVLYAHDAGNLATELWNSSTLPSNVAGNAVKFAVPTVANGHVYVGTRGNNVGGASNSTSTPGELDIYGLLP